jgi:glyoxylase-like metal-dependent hydrolase (beta-lactamase superfamily II)
MEVEIHSIPMGFDTIYAIRGEGVILVDGGDPDRFERFKKGLERASIAPDEIRLLIATHGHWDHVGSIKEIKELTGAEVLMHRDDEHFLQDAHPAQPPGLTAWGKVLTTLIRLFLPFVAIPTFDVDRFAEGDEEISLTAYGIPGVVIHTPGHTHGSLSVLLESGEAFVGDLAMNRMPLRRRPGMPIFGDDAESIRQSWRKLLDRGAKRVYPAHGDPFPAEVMAREI